MMQVLRPVGLVALAVLVCAAAPPKAAVQLQFNCDVALLMPNRQFTAPTPVSILFVFDHNAIRDIRVIDTGGILFPGGNMKMLKTDDAIRLDTVPIPEERPGTWSGTVEKKKYNLTLASGALTKAIVIGLGRVPSKETGRYGLAWNATHQPEGMPRPLSGSGGGNCARVDGNGL